MSFSSSISGNRPPALSTSSISSYGEDATISSNKFVQENGLNYTPASPLTPSSSLNYFSHPGASSSFSPGLHGNNSNNEDAPLRLPIIESKSEDSVSKANNGQDKINNHQYLSYDMNMEGRKNSSSNDALTHKGCKESVDKKEDAIWNPRHSQEYSSSNNSFNFLGSWPQYDKVLTSPGTKSTTSIPNMGSVNENEEFHGNRLRARTMSSSTGHRSIHGNFVREQDSPMSPSNEHLYINSGNGYVKTQLSSTNQQFCDIPYSQSIPENMMHPQCKSLDMSAMRTSSRQRIMSADNVNRHNVTGRNMFATPDPVFNQPSIILHNHRIIENSSNNRQRSYSSGATYGRGQHPFFDLHSANDAPTNHVSRRYTFSQTCFLNFNVLSFLTETWHSPLYFLNLFQNFS
jgi:hypothetical protein